MVASVGQIIDGKYRVEGELGRGGMGTVLMARHLVLDERVAIKVMHGEVAEEPELQARFRREAQAAAKIRSEHVCRVFDVALTEQGEPYMALEFLEGTDLDRLVKERGPLSESEAIGYVLQACDALSEAHEYGIVHRDLKPANLFLTHRRNGQPLIKVLDFGISKMRRQGQAELTASRVVMGSAPYMSPEQARDASQVDHRSDIWSLGIVLHLLVTGRRPFQATSTTGYIATIVADPPIPLAHHRPDVNPVLAAVVARCLEKNPDHRFQDVANLATSLAACAPEHESLLVGFVSPRSASRGLPTSTPVAHGTADASSQATIGPVETRGARAGRSRWRPLVGAAMTLALLAGAAAYVGRPPSAVASPGLALAVMTLATGWAATVDTQGRSRDRAAETAASASTAMAPSDPPTGAAPEATSPPQAAPSTSARLPAPGPRPAAPTRPKPHDDPFAYQ